MWFITREKTRENDTHTILKNNKREKKQKKWIKKLKNWKRKYLREKLFQRNIQRHFYKLNSWWSSVIDSRFPSFFFCWLWHMKWNWNNNAANALNLVYEIYHNQSFSGYACRLCPPTWKRLTVRKPLSCCRLFDQMPSLGVKWLKCNRLEIQNEELYCQVI